MTTTQWKIGDKATCWDLVELARKIHHSRQDFEEGDIVDRIKNFGVYILQEIPISQIDRGSYAIDEDLVDEYAEQSQDTMPPVILGDIYGKKYDAVDGNHRVESAVLRKDETILSFVPIYETRIESDDYDEEENE